MDDVKERRGGNFLCAKGGGDGSDDEAGLVDFFVGLADGGDDAFAAEGGGAEVDEDDLILVVVDVGAELFFELGFFEAGEVALEDGKLKVPAKVPAGLKNPAEALGVADVVGDDVIAAFGHGG